MAKAIRKQNQAVTSTKATDPKSPEGASHATRCAGCNKSKKIVTHPHEQGLCSRCNMLLVRRHGPNYAEHIDNPAAMIQLIDERLEKGRDIKVVRKGFFQILNLMDQFDLSEQQRRYVFRGFANVFEGLPEAQSFLTFHNPQDNVKTAGGSEDDLRESANDSATTPDQ